MSDTTLDLREVPPPARHPKVFEAFDALESGETLTLINDHPPTPLFYQFEAEVESFDAANSGIEARGEREFVATLPKK